MSENQVKDRSQASTAELMRDLSRQLTDLVHEEVQLAKAELTQKARRTGAGASLLVGAGGLAALAAGACVAAAVAALSQVMSVWLGALITAAGLALLAGLTATVAVVQLSRGTPLAPNEAINDTKEEVEWLKSRAKSARR